MRSAQTGETLPFANLELRELALSTATDADGRYRLVLTGFQTRQTLTLRATYIGKNDAEVTVNLLPGQENRQDIRLADRNLSLGEVEVNARRSGQQVSNSSIVIGRQAIEQTQAYSLDDVLQLLPGQTIGNGNLQGARTINLRSATLQLPSGTATGTDYNQNNAFGTAIIVDGAQWSNNANFQADDPGRFGAFKDVATVPGSANSTYNSGNYAANGVDLRMIPANNIESVEVIQGVASARYGDLSTGAIIVNRQAGATPLRLSVRTQNATTELTAGKGFTLSKHNTMNLNLTYLNANDEPQFSNKTYNRITGSLMLTTRFGRERQHRHTLSVDGNTTLDDARTDPDDNAANQRTYSLDQRLSVANRGSLHLKTAAINLLNYQFGGSYGYQKSYNYWLLNQGVRPVTDALVSGTHQGQFAPGSYGAERSVIGKPLNLYARIDNTLLGHTGGWQHTLTGGLSVSYDKNYGQGRIFDALRPRSNPQGGKGERPYRFSDTPGMLQAGAFVEDQITREWGKRKLIANVGLRYDNQNSFSTLSPRINLKFYPTEYLQLNAAYGLATKAPGLLHRYPGLLYFDVPLLVNYTNNYRENLFLVHTEVFNPANADLRPAQARTLELGLNLNHHGYSISLTAYRKEDINGFNVSRKLLNLQLPNYQVTDRPANQLPVVAEVGAPRAYLLSYGFVNNQLRTDNRGLELLVRTPRIKWLQTSFDLNTALTQSLYFYGDGAYNLRDPNQNAPDFQTTLFVRETLTDRNSYQLVSTLSSTTNIPQLGFLVTLRGQMFWGRWAKNLDLFKLAEGFYTTDGQYQPITAQDYAEGRYLYLRSIVSEEISSQPIPYGVVHLRLSKEIRKKYRLSFFANNALNIRPELVDQLRASRQVFNSAPTFGAEIVLNFN